MRTSTEPDRGLPCNCDTCLTYPPTIRPGDRSELANPDRELITTVAAITNARLGVDDDWATYPASHCDIDRATRLLTALDHHRRSTAGH